MPRLLVHYVRRVLELSGLTKFPVLALLEVLQVWLNPIDQLGRLVATCRGFVLRRVLGRPQLESPERYANEKSGKGHATRRAPVV